jgi:aminopeptidase-like protein
MSTSASRQPLRVAALGDADARSAGESMLGLMRDLLPFCRSITGAGVRATLARVAAAAPLHVTEIPTGTQIFDWTVPKEWHIEDAYLEHESGRRFAEFGACNLHVMSYSAPVDATFTLAELRERLHSLPQHPDWVPWRSSYYREDWGFCLADRVKQALPEGKYRAVIRSRLHDGALTYGEHLHRGRTDEEVLVFTHVCHPSLANDNLSGIAVATELARYLAGRDTRYSYRFLFAPATIGSIAWLATNEHRLGAVRHGLVLAMLGDGAPLNYQRTFGGRAAIDRAAAAVLGAHYADGGLHDFSPWGFDERQFNTPGIRLPVGRLTRALTGKYAEEHTSADTIDKLSAGALGESWRACLRIFETLEHADERYTNTQPKGEPQLGRRGLYRQSGGYYDSVPERHLALLWLLHMSDGSASLLDITERAKLPFGLILECARDLERAGLLVAN